MMVVTQPERHDCECVCMCVCVYVCVCALPCEGKMVLKAEAPELIY